MTEEEFTEIAVQAAKSPTGRDHGQARKDRVALVAEVRRLQAERDAIDKEEVAHGQTIDERDAAEEALSQVVYLVTGRSPPWSNIYGHVAAIEEVGDCVSVLKQAARDAAPPPGAIEMLKEVAEQLRFYQRNHEANGATDKALVNQRLAERCEAVLAGQPAPLPGGQTVEQAIEAFHLASAAAATGGSSAKAAEANRALLRAIAAREAAIARAAAEREREACAAACETQLRIEADAGNQRAFQICQEMTAIIRSRAPAPAGHVCEHDNTVWCSICGGPKP